VSWRQPAVVPEIISSCPCSALWPLRQVVTTCGPIKQSSSAAWPSNWGLAGPGWSCLKAR